MSINDVVDIQIENGQIIQVKKANFDIFEIQNKISKMKYNGQSLVKDVKVENSQIPSIAKVFYMFIFDNKMPTGENLFNSYLAFHFNQVGTDNCISHANGETYSIEGIRARVLRAFPSLLRDFHFYLLCQNSGIFNKVRYSFIADSYEGIDLKVDYKGEEYAISLFVSTKRSEGFKKKKYKRHDYSNLKEICISIDPFDKKNYVGNYALYNESHISLLIEEIEKMKIK